MRQEAVHVFERKTNEGDRTLHQVREKSCLCHQGTRLSRPQELGKWYKMYFEKQETGVPYEKRYAKVPSFSQEEQEAAVRHYLSAFLQATSMKS